jgi:4-amino-4-deoxychorismate lyase
MHTLINGQADERLDARDRGLHYGDGIFETIAIIDGRPRFPGWHFERLAQGATCLGIPLPDFDQLRAEITVACPEPRGVAKVILTRGVGPRGYRPPTHPVPTRIVAASPWPDWEATRWSGGVRLGWCRTRYGRNPALAGIKHLNRLEQVLARAEWDDGSMDEGLMQDDRDGVISATQCNVFARIEGRWTTPALDQCGVAGIMRRAFLGWSADAGDPAVVRALPSRELALATHLFLTNALIGAWPVREFAGRKFAIDPRVAQFNEWLARQ